MKLWEKVNNLCGCGGKSRVIVEHLNQASKWVVSSLPEKFLWSVASTSEVTAGTGSGIAYDKILAVYRNQSSNKRLAKEVPDHLAYAFESNSGSLFSATTLFPKYYKLEGKIFIKPDPDSTNTGNIVYAAPPLVDENTDTWVLVEWENIVLMYAGALDFLRQSETKQSSANTELSTVSTLLATYDSAVPAYSAPSAPSVPSFSFSGTAPEFTSGSLHFDPPTFAFTGTLDIGTLSTDDPSIGAAPTPTISYSAPPNSAPALPTSITHGSNLPTLNLPGDHGVTSTVIDNAVTKAQNLIDNAAGEGGLDQDAEDLLNEEDSEMLQAVISTASQEIQRAQTAIAKEKLLLDDYSGEVQKGIQAFQQDVAKWQAELQRLMSDADTKLKTYSAKQADAVQTMQAQIADAQDALGAYQAESNAKIQQMQAQVGEFSANAQARVSVYVSERDTAIQTFTAQAQQSVTEFQAKATQYIQDNTMRIQEYQATVSKLLQDYQAKIQGNTATFTNGLAAAKKSLEQAQMRLQTSQAYTQQSQQDFQRSTTLYQWALGELTAATGAASAPPQQQAAQRSEEQRSTQ